MTVTQIRPESLESHHYQAIATAGVGAIQQAVTDGLIRVQDTYEIDRVRTSFLWRHPAAYPETFLQFGFDSDRTFAWFSIAHGNIHVWGIRRHLNGRSLEVRGSSAERPGLRPITENRELRYDLPRLLTVENQTFELVLDSDDASPAVQDPANRGGMPPGLIEDIIATVQNWQTTAGLLTPSANNSDASEVTNTSDTPS